MNRRDFLTGTIFSEDRRLLPHQVEQAVFQLSDILRHGNDVIPADADTVLVANSTMVVVHRDQLRSWGPHLVVLGRPRRAHRPAQSGADLLAGGSPFHTTMEVADITPENVARAVGGKVERNGSILCCCPVHEASGTHNSSLVLSITDDRHILFHCRSQKCDAGHFGAIRDHLVKCGLPRSHVGGSSEIRYVYQHPDGCYAWTKTRYVTKSGKKRFRCEVFNWTTKEWSSGRPEGLPLLFNLAAIANVLATYPTVPLLVVEGERDATTAGNLGLLATTNADGAGKWRVEDTQQLIKLGVRKVIVCPDNDAPGIDHGIRVAKSFQQAGVEVRWLELPELGAKEDLSDWAPNQTSPDAGGPQPWCRCELDITPPPWARAACNHGGPRHAARSAPCPPRALRPGGTLASPEARG
jgi:hypothetical protein